MMKFAPLAALFLLTACGGTRADECEVDGCDETVVTTCRTSVEACETAGGPLVDTCIDAVVAAGELSCEVGGDDTDS